MARHFLRFLSPLTLLTLAVMPCGAVPAADAPAASAIGAEPLSGDELDELLIQGKRLYQLRKEMVEAEDRFYKLYNELNEDDDYDVHCARVARSGSHITERVCKPEFYAEAETEYAVAMFTGYNAPPPELVALQRGDEYRATALDLVKKHPELQRMLKERAELERGYQKARKERFKDHWIQF